jgi:hypothetical protein
MLDDPKGAERLARAILDDITLDHDARVRATRDLTTDLAKEIEEGRALFRSRVAPELHRVYEEELLPWRGRARDQALRIGGAGIDRGRLLFAVGAAVVLVAVVAWLVLRSS